MSAHVTYNRRIGNGLILCAFDRLPLYLAGIVAIIHPLHVIAQNVQPPDQPLAIETAWKHRKDVIKSLVLKAEVVEVIKGRGGLPAKQIGPLTDNPPKTDRLSVSKAEYYYDEGKTAATRTGPVSTGDDSEKTVDQTFRDI